MLFPAPVMPMTATKTSSGRGSKSKGCSIVKERRYKNEISKEGGLEKPHAVQANP